MLLWRFPRRCFVPSYDVPHYASSLEALTKEALWKAKRNTNEPMPDKFTPFNHKLSQENFFVKPLPLFLFFIYLFFFEFENWD